jgi:hypothetical protein
MKFKFLLLLLITTILCLTSFGSRTYAADSGSILNKACQSAKDNPTCNQAAKQTASPNKNPVTKTINTATNILALAAGVIAVVMIIISGLSFVTSGGDPNRVKNARSTLIFSVVGLAIVALAWVIVRFITDRVIQ